MVLGERTLQPSNNLSTMPPLWPPNHHFSESDDAIESRIKRVLNIYGNAARKCSYSTRVDPCARAAIESKMGKETIRAGDTWPQ